MSIEEKFKGEIKELFVLMKMKEKYEEIIKNGILPVDHMSSLCHQKRLIRISELISELSAIYEAA